MLAAACALGGGARAAWADSSPASAVNPRWHACGGEHAPDAPKFSKQIALTFDDGPSVKFTPKVLSVLRRHKAPATFFVVGRRAGSRKARAILREIVRDPLFELGNHTFSHPRMKSLSLGDARREVDRTRARLDSVGAPVRFFRFPYAESTCATAKLVRSRGYAVAGWHIDSADWCFAVGRGRCSAKRWKRIPDRFRSDMKGLILHRARATGGGILLLHDVHGWSADQLDGLLTALTDDGFRFVALSDPAVFPLLQREIGAP